MIQGAIFGKYNISCVLSQESLAELVFDDELCKWLHTQSGGYSNIVLLGIVATI